MKKIITIVIATFFAATLTYAADPINPLTGEPMKQTVVTPKPEKTSPKPMPGMPSMQNPYIPAPSFQQPMQPQNMQVQKKDEEKKRELKPEERYVIDGIVNNNVVIIDLLNEEKYMQVSDLTLLDNGGLVKYPYILFGDKAKKALKLNSEKDDLSDKVLALSKENSAIKHKLTISSLTVTKQDIELEHLKSRLAAFDKTLSEKQKAVLQFTANQKTNSTELDSVKKRYESQITTNKKAYDTELTTLRKTNTDNTATIKSIEPKLSLATAQLKTSQDDTKDAMRDMSMLTNIIFKSSIGTDYNIPKIGKFKGVLHENLIFAFVPIESKDKADAYLKPTMLRAYKTDKYVLYINNKKLVED